tara:strand:+ start:269 stop:970 length:702 start_codon:yes stop_codon:yes gene_type:complete
MNVALISDIHANAHALQAVLNAAKSKNVNKILCCGDYVGYYYEPKRMINLLNDWEWEGISGNHDIMLKDWLKENKRDEIYNKYGSSISIAANQLTPNEAKFIYDRPKSLKIEIDNYKVLICHGSPWDRDNYIYPDSNPELINKLFDFDLEIDLLVYGHTHYPVKWEKNNMFIINPGSVGQPRDRKPGASWVLWNTTSNEFNFFREEYDIKPVVDMCKKYDPNKKYLIDVLKRK